MVRKLFQSGGSNKTLRSFALIAITMIVIALFVSPGVYNRGVDWMASTIKIRLPKVSERPFSLGLDLQGGTHLVYEANVSEIDSSDRTAAIEGVRDVIERRVNVFGVSEPLVQTSISGGSYRIIVELAGIQKVDEAIKMIGETPLLEFKEQIAENRELTVEEKKQLDEFNVTAKIKADEALNKAKAGEDFAALAKTYNQDQNTLNTDGNLGWLKESEIQPIFEYIKGLSAGQVYSTLITESNGYRIIKLNDKRIRTNAFNNNQPEKEVKASHILLCYTGSEGCSANITKEEALAKMKEIEKKATPANFAALAKENSTDPGAANGGDLGWFTRDAMVAPFADTVFDNTKVGEISYIVETKFGYHLIYKQAEREVTEYNISHIYIGTASANDLLDANKQWKLTELTGKNLDKSLVQFDPNDNSPIVALKFDSEGATMFEAITERNIGKPVGIFLDGQMISAPTVQTRIAGGEAVITGKFDINEAKLLAQRLNAGALPVPIELVSQNTIGAALGQQSLNDSMKAGLIGLLFVALFMIIVYRLPGFLSVISLICYCFIVMFLFKLVPITLTLAGIAGFVLSIGMAVDANVLIFARLREEMADGAPLNLAIERAFDRAWPSIRDGNLSTIITCLILIYFTTSMVKGFAITLTIGVVVSMLSAIIITRVLMFLFSGWMQNKKWLIK